MRVKEIEAATLELPAEDLPRLVSWLVEYQAEVWDKEIESDLDCRKLDSLLSEVDLEYTAGMATPV